MISSESRTISGLRRSSTPRAPVANRNADRVRYQETSGPCTAPPSALAPENHPADGRDEQHDRGDLEGEEVVGQEDLTDLGRAAEARTDVGLTVEPACGGKPD